MKNLKILMIFAVFYIVLSSYSYAYIEMDITFENFQGEDILMRINNIRDVPINNSLPEYGSTVTEDRDNVFNIQAFGLGNNLLYEHIIYESFYVLDIGYVDFSQKVFTIPYDSREISVIKILYAGQERTTIPITSGDSNILCNLNSNCDSNENYLSCPEDCKWYAQDGICTSLGDIIDNEEFYYFNDFYCDPDCLDDPDCNNPNNCASEDSQALKPAICTQVEYCDLKEPCTLEEVTLASEYGFYCPECFFGEMNDGICNLDEHFSNKTDDCINLRCGNNICDKEEDYLSCPEDCYNTCGNGLCEIGENCIQDCPISITNTECIVGQDCLFFEKDDVRHCSKAYPYAAKNCICVNEFCKDSICQYVFPSSYDLKYKFCGEEYLDCSYKTKDNTVKCNNGKSFEIFDPSFCDITENRIICYQYEGCLLSDGQIICTNSFDKLRNMFNATNKECYQPLDKNYKLYEPEGYENCHFTPNTYPVNALTKCNRTEPSAVAAYELECQTCGNNFCDPEDNGFLQCPQDCRTADNNYDDVIDNQEILLFLAQDFTESEEEQSIFRWKMS